MKVTGVQTFCRHRTKPSVIAAVHIAFAEQQICDLEHFNAERWHIDLSVNKVLIKPMNFQ